MSALHPPVSPGNGAVAPARMQRPRCHRNCRVCGALVAASPAGPREGLTAKHLTKLGRTCAGSSLRYVEHPLRPELRDPQPPSAREQVAVLVGRARVLALTSGDETLRDLSGHLALVAEALVELAGQPEPLPPGVVSLAAYRLRRAGGAR